MKLDSYLYNIKVLKGFHELYKGTELDAFFNNWEYSYTQPHDEEAILRDIKEQPYNLPKFKALMLGLIIRRFTGNHKTDFSPLVNHYVKQCRDYVKANRKDTTLPKRDVPREDVIQIQRLFNFYKDRLKRYKTVSNNVSIDWTDGINTYNDVIPFVGELPDGRVDLHLTFHKAVVRKTAANQRLDVVRIPSLIRCIGHFLHQGKTVHRVYITYLHAYKCEDLYQNTYYTIPLDKSLENYIRDYTNPANWVEHNLQNYPPAAYFYPELRHNYRFYNKRDPLKKPKPYYGV